MDDLHYLSATDALRMFRSKELSPVALMEAVIARADIVEPVVNAFTYTYFDRALDAARAAARRRWPPRRSRRARREEQQVARAVRGHLERVLQRHDPRMSR